LSGTPDFYSMCNIESDLGLFMEEERAEKRLLTSKMILSDSKSPLATAAAACKQKSSHTSNNGNRRQNEELVLNPICTRCLSIAADGEKKRSIANCEQLMKLATPFTLTALRKTSSTMR
jgi:hypothetical protein